ncbi:hypothetical protein M9458_010462, partial [Cirrhinus mrigala]
GHEWPPCPWSVEWLPSHVAHQLPGDAGHVSGKHFLPDLRDCHVLVCTDKTMVYYINQGGLCSCPLYKLAHQILVWSQDKLLSLRAVHVPGHLNMGADILSGPGSGCFTMSGVHRIPRRPVCPPCRELSSQYFPPGNIAGLGSSLPPRGSLKLLVRAFPAGPPFQDTKLAAQTTPEASLERLVPLVDYLATEVIAFSSGLVTKQEVATLLSKESNGVGTSSLQGVRVLQSVLHSSGEDGGVASEGAHFIASGLSTEVVETILHFRALSMRKLYALKWRLFTSWCGHRQQDPVNCPVGTVLEFLQDRFSAGLAHSILKVYVVAF